MKKLPFRRGNRIKCRCCNQKGKILETGVTSPDRGYDCTIIFDGHQSSCGAYLKDLVHLPKKRAKRVVATWVTY
jgi:hypothetical protein